MEQSIDFMSKRNISSNRNGDRICEKNTQVNEEKKHRFLTYLPFSVWKNCTSVRMITRIYRYHIRFNINGSNMYSSRKIALMIGNRSVVLADYFHA